jgi:hypothetical protein
MSCRRQRAAGGQDVSTLPNPAIDLPDIADMAADDRHAALTYLNDAWVEAVRDGLEEEYLVQAALFTALRNLVATYGEDACAEFVESLGDRVRSGEYTIAGSRH